MESKLILVINAGSSSLKFCLYDLTSLYPRASGIAESLHLQNPTLTFKKYRNNLHTVDTSTHSLNIKNAEISPYSAAINQICTLLQQNHLINVPLLGIGHRVVHGGEIFTRSARINDQVKQHILACSPLAPLHNPTNLLGIEATEKVFPDTPQVAVFDTAFHQTLPRHAFLYALPKEMYHSLGIRRYGFHGTSHHYVTQQAAKHINKPFFQSQFISAHLGNGCSITAIKNGKSVDTSMGFTPLEGLIMGTRSGDIDPGLFDFLNQKGYSVSKITDILNKQSGLQGISSLSHDMRTLIKASKNGNSSASLAIDMFCFRLAKYISAMSASLTQIDALIFTGGIGEHAALVRKKTLDHLPLLGFSIDDKKNLNHGKNSQQAISTKGSTTALVITTNEEWMIAQETLGVLTHSSVAYD